MSVIRRWLGSASAPETRSTMESLILSSACGIRSSSGVAVTEESSLRNTAVLACVRLLANSTAMLPLPVYRRVKHIA